jgi:fumarate reductase subunit C
MERHFFALQRLTALAMAPFVLVHLFVILYAVRGGLTVGEILSRTQGSWLWISFYGLFVLCSAVHVPIGLRNVLIEWARMPRGAATLLCYVLMVVFAVLGMRAVLSVGGLA